MKKSIILSTLILLLCFNALAQDKKFHFGVSFNPNYSYRYYYSDISFLKTRFDSTDVPILSFSAGFFAERRISNKSKVHIGFNVINTGFSRKKIALNSWGSNGGSNSSNLSSDYFKTSSVFYYFELPIDFCYFIDKKKRFAIHSGISSSINFLNKTTISTYYADGKRETKSYEDKVTPYNKFVANAHLGISYEIPISSKFVLEIQPRFHYFITPLVKNTNNTNANLYNGGLQVSLRM